MDKLDKMDNMDKMDKLDSVHFIQFIHFQDQKKVWSVRSVLCHKRRQANFRWDKQVVGIFCLEVWLSLKLLSGPSSRFGSLDPNPG